MKKTWKILLCCICITGLLLNGCGLPAKNTEEQAVTFADGITVKGTLISVDGREMNPAEQNENVTAIADCKRMGPEMIAIEGILKGNADNLYFTIYSLPEQRYVYEQYGQLFAWRDDDPDSLVYVQNLSESGGTSQVKNSKDMVLFTTGEDEQIADITYVPKGVRIDVTDDKGSLLRSVVVEMLSEPPEETAGEEDETDEVDGADASADTMQ